MINLAFVTGSRADYGIMRHYLERLNNDEGISLSILATGALLDDTFGHQVELIYQDGFKVEKEIDVPIETSSNEAILHTMAITQDKFATYFAQAKIDLLIILGDRYEMLSVAIAASMQRIPILHIHGGEATYGNYDEFIRHAITKMSLYHFVATKEYRKRVIQLGEDPKRVYYVGALGAENCQYIDDSNVPDSVKKLKDKRYYVVLFHPETLTNVSVEQQVDELLQAIKNHSDVEYVFLGTNADTHSEIIREKIHKFVMENRHATYFENLNTDAYHFLLKNSICLIGNSSSGLIEAPSLGIYTINIGDRQKGRVRGSSVLDVECRADKIDKAMKMVLTNKNTVIENPYYKENTAEEYYKKTLEILKHLQEDISEPKVFYDIK